MRHLRFYNDIIFIFFHLQIYDLFHEGNPTVKSAWAKRWGGQYPQFARTVEMLHYLAAPAYNGKVL